MLRLRRPLVDHDQRGAMTVAAIVVLALLFTTGAVLSLAVSADLHAVNLETSQDQVHYTAESNLARGTAAALQAGGGTCPGAVASPGSSSDPSPAASPLSSQGSGDFECEPPVLDVQQPVGQLAQPARRAVATATPSPLSCIAINLDSLGGAGGTPWAVWTVIGARGLAAVSSYDTWVATSPTAPCSSAKSDSPVQTVTIGQADATYHSFLVTNAAPEFLYILVRSGQVAFSPFVVRGASHGGPNQVVTVIGRSTSSAGGGLSVLEADEADLYLPAPGGSPTAGLWRTVLP